MGSRECDPAGVPDPSFATERFGDRSQYCKPRYVVAVDLGFRGRCTANTVCVSSDMTAIFPPCAFAISLAIQPQAEPGFVGASLIVSAPEWIEDVHERFPINRPLAVGNRDTYFGLVAVHRHAGGSPRISVMNGIDDKVVQ